MPTPDPIPPDVPHGSVTAHWYASAVTGTRRRMHVYTPPGYEAGGRRLPVLYLLHGSANDDESWTREGRAHWIMDELLAAGRARPMIVAMPDGRMAGADWKERRAEKTRAFVQELHTHVVPEVERLYRAGEGRAQRALAGLSMGGGQVVAAGLTRPELFSAFGIFSAGLWPELEPMLTPALPGLKAMPPETLWIGIGRRDFVYKHCEALRRAIEGAGVAYMYHEDDTAHTWLAWRDYLGRFAPLIFPCV